MEFGEFGVEVSRQHSLSFAVALLFSDGFREGVEFISEARILLVARLPEGGDDLRVGCAFNRIGSKDSCLAARRDDLLLQPLKVFTGLLGRGQDIDRSFERDCAEPLQLAPDANAQIRRRGRKLMNQQQPFQL